MPRYQVYFTVHRHGHFDIYADSQDEAEAQAEDMLAETNLDGLIFFEDEVEITETHVEPAGPAESLGTDIYGVMELEELWWRK